MAETRNKKAEELKPEETKINGQIEEGEIARTDQTSIVTPEDIDEPMVVEDGVVLAEDKCADHISRKKVLDVIESTMAKYEGKVVLAMEEVRNIIKAITTAVKE